MFEHYTEHARRVIFFSRYEASQFGSPYIEPEHMLLALLRERMQLRDLVPASLTEDGVRREFEAMGPRLPPTSTSVDLPVSKAVARALAYAAEEAERTKHDYIGPQHLLLGLLREDTPASAILRRHGLELEQVRQKVAEGMPFTRPAAEEDHTLITALREQFRRVAERLTADVEPASVYRLSRQDQETE